LRLRRRMVHRLIFGEMNDYQTCDELS